MFNTLFITKSLLFITPPVLLVALFLSNFSSKLPTYEPKILITPSANHSENCTKLLSDDFIDFEGFDNNRDKFCTPIIPNFIHLIYLNKNEMKFYEIVNIYSIFLRQKPDRIYIHCDLCDFKGYYWEKLNSIEEIKKIIVINQILKLDTIFGKKVKWIHHRYIFSFIYKCH